jgi:hypothetical protein
VPPPQPEGAMRAEGWAEAEKAKAQREREPCESAGKYSDRLLEQKHEY